MNARPRGQGLAEYGLILVLVAIVVIVALQLLGPTVRDMFVEINDGIVNALP